MQPCLSYLTSAPNEGQLSAKLAQLNRDKLNHTTPTFFAKGTLEKSGTADITFTSTAAPIVLTEIAQHILSEASFARIERQSLWRVGGVLSGYACVLLTIKVSNYLLASSLTLIGPKMQFSIELAVGTGLGIVVGRVFWLKGTSCEWDARAKIEKAIQELTTTYQATVTALKEENATFDRVAIQLALCKAGIPSESANQLVLLLPEKKKAEKGLV
jgi:hypothetical protein